VQLLHRRLGGGTPGVGYPWFRMSDLPNNIWSGIVIVEGIMGSGKSTTVLID
jgi:hypothetical protein